MQQIGIYREQLLALIRAIGMAGLSYPLLALAPNTSDEYKKRHCTP